MAITERAPVSPAEQDGTPASTISALRPPHNDQDPQVADAERLEAEVFIDSGYVENAEELKEEYAPYEAVSTFGTVHTPEGELSGVVRIIADSPNGFKTVNDARAGKLAISPEGWTRIEAIDPTKTAEVGTISVPKHMRGSNAARPATLLQGFILGYSVENDVDTLVASIDRDYYNLMKFVFGDTVQELGEFQDYMGSDTIPVIMNPFDMHEHVKSNPKMQELAAQIEAASKSIV